ncbi:GDH/6PGL endoplasmic bifunctional protein isoform X4 [Sciurus carolinensis]|nr:GDH/6PGL endoplasmic bifunctional protein isoform X4 [Sciurus carolinensis]XP_047409568.1 GDH/6PGL endoplasmic bifunctional protein isoform X4 [Sciurus carolinensis]XP_047409577.1 GDH/6PGL endoplasmic bifunctional protein isoform X4 [Sciurus carolinensis]XP_047409586.1 GDH/6PGL endoplasmic bifunctional protein isoform X4 [Sciurus carolinensis]XP_047409596.1 GDH/6PGL endoplasmic bifunctional protein isoform X4 [Sciurus carolinensis]
MLTVAVCVALLGYLQAQELQGHVSIILMGATGDLAKKYLWQALFQLYLDEAGKGHSFSFHGAALTAPKQGQELMTKALESLSCPQDMTRSQCVELKGQFLRLSQYRQLKTAEDYRTLSKDIEAQVQREGLREAGRIFYFSVPPFAYADIARNINSSCRPGPGTWLRVVLEKPFGHDHLSAQQLATELGSFFQEEEMYRVDHYLGKQAVAQILPFRDQNRQVLDRLWNRHHVERVEVIMKETVDAEGRTSFYEEYGVIRDTLQNHLTEILTLVAMELPHEVSSSEAVLQHKLQAFRALRGLQRGSAVVGQYQTYSGQVRRELQKPDDFHSLTPTFAAVLVHVDNLRWEGVPFILMSGKALDERVGYVRILFKNRAFCVQGERHGTSEQSPCLPRQVIFYIGHGELGHPAILVSRNLFRPTLPTQSWTEVQDRPGLRLFGRPLSDYYAYSPVREQDAYSILLSHIFHRRKESFITTENLLASWVFWTPLLDSLAREVPRIYPGGAENGHLLDFEFSGGQLSFSQQQPEQLVPGPGSAPRPSDFQVLRTTYRESPLVSAWPEELISKLAEDIEATAVQAVQCFGEFHLALSGGSSPQALFQQLATGHYGFPWAHTHLWLVDERCVPLSDPESNFQGLQAHLLQHIRIPYYNIHPMPVHLHQRLCAEEDQGAQTYAREISALVANSSFHLVLLGMGTDGHTASLFPQSPAGLDGEQLVVLTESPLRPHQRMSLSLPLINRAKKVVVLVMGRMKREITMLVSRVGHQPKKWPISGVLPKSGQLVWYMDFEAFLG